VLSRWLSMALLMRRACWISAVVRDMGHQRYIIIGPQAGLPPLFAARPILAIDSRWCMFSVGQGTRIRQA
jgi:hypothetical protein